MLVVYLLAAKSCNKVDTPTLELTNAELTRIMCDGDANEEHHLALDKRRIKAGREYARKHHLTLKSLFVNSCCRPSTRLPQLDR